jgi:hypothetical protein
VVGRLPFVRGSFRGRELAVWLRSLPLAGGGRRRDLGVGQSRRDDETARLRRRVQRADDKAGPEGRGWRGAGGQAAEETGGGVDVSAWERHRQLSEPELA